jgi:curved DNA-binding protein CbpA
MKESNDKPPPASASHGGGWRLTLDPASRKVVIALAVSGETETLSDLAAATGLDPAVVDSILVNLAAKGMVIGDLPQTASAFLPETGAEAPGDEAGHDIFGPEELPHEPASDSLPAAPVAASYSLESLQECREGLKSKNYYDMLGVAPDAGLKEIRRAYYDLVSEFHPDRRREIEDPAAKEVLAEIFELLTEAYETLRSKKRRQRYDRTIPAVTGAVESEEEEALALLFEEPGPEPAAAHRAAEKPLGWNFYQTAVEAFQAGDYAGADLNFKLAVGMDPERAEYREGLQRTREIITANLLAELKREAESLEAQRKFPEAVVALSKATELDPVDPELRYALARLRFLKTLDRLRAEEDVSWAVSLDPNHVDALLLMGRIQAWKGNTDAAIATFKQVLRIAPGHPKAKQALALFEKT